MPRVVPTLTALALLSATFLACAPPPSMTLEPDAGAAGDAGTAEDAGARNDDAGAAQDAGAADYDAGAPPDDAGAIEPDAGAIEPDAGATELDAGAHPGDAGTATSCDGGDPGASCSDCAEGYTLIEGNCVPDACSDIVCVNGSCEIGGGGPVCLCEGGFIGDACDACPEGYHATTTPQGLACLNVLPAVSELAAALTGWFDAADLTTLELTAEAHVDRWRNKGAAQFWMSPYSNVTTPAYLLFDRSVVLDGNDDLLVSNVDYLGTSAAYSVWLVVSWNPAAGNQWLYATVGQSGDIEGHQGYGLTIQVEGGGTVSATHRGSFQSTGGDVVVGDFFAAAGQRQLVRVERQPLLNGYALTISNGAEAAIVEATEPAFDQIVPSLFGGRDGQTASLDGTLNEILLYQGTLTAAERDAIESYLRVKWQLP